MSAQGLTVEQAQQMMADREVVQVVVHPRLLPDLVAWLEERQLILGRVPSSADDLPTYTTSPTDERLAEVMGERSTGALLPEGVRTFVVTRTWRVRANSAVAAVEVATPGTHAEVTAAQVTATEERARYERYAEYMATTPTFDEDDEVRIPAYMARQVSADSWLNEEPFARVKYALQYAALKTRAIPGLSKVTPEEAYWSFVLMERGAAQYDARKAAGELP